MCDKIYNSYIERTYLHLYIQYTVVGRLSYNDSGEIALYRKKQLSDLMYNISSPSQGARSQFFSLFLKMVIIAFLPHTKN